jgi:hypothetical protein
MLEPSDGKNGKLWDGYGFAHYPCYGPFIMASQLAKALSQHSADELRKMLDDARTTAQRSQFEVEVIEEALSTAKERPKAPVAAPQTDRPSPEEIRERILRIISELGPVPPKPVREAINDESINVYNALGQLVKEDRLTYEDGLYALPTSSANGWHPEGQRAGTAA